MAKIVQTEEVTPGSTEEFIFTPLVDGRRVELSHAVMLRKNMDTGATEEFSTGGPGPVLTIEGGGNYRLRLTPAASFWPAAHVTYRGWFRLTLAGGGVLEFPKLGCIAFPVVEHY